MSIEGPLSKLIVKIDNTTILNARGGDSVAEELPHSKLFPHGKVNISSILGDNTIPEGTWDGPGAFDDNPLGQQILDAEANLRNAQIGREQEAEARRLSEEAQSQRVSQEWEDRLEEAHQRFLHFADLGWDMLRQLEDTDPRIANAPFHHVIRDESRPSNISLLMEWGEKRKLSPEDEAVIAAYEEAKKKPRKFRPDDFPDKLKVHEYSAMGIFFTWTKKGNPGAPGLFNENPYDTDWIVSAERAAISIGTGSYYINLREHNSVNLRFIEEGAVIPDTHFQNEVIKGIGIILAKGVPIVDVVPKYLYRGDNYKKADWPPTLSTDNY